MKWLEDMAGRILLTLTAIFMTPPVLLFSGLDGVVKMWRIWREEVGAQ